MPESTAGRRLAASPEADEFSLPLLVFLLKIISIG
jgi:hypothetical protein